MLARLQSRYTARQDPLRTERRLELLVWLLALCLALQLLYGVFALRAVKSPEAVAPAEDSLRVQDVLALDGITGSESQQLRDRPLFWMGRRPTGGGDEAVLADDKAGEIDGMRLVGVFGSGRDAGIIVTLNDDRKRLRIGDSIKGWRLDKVDGGEAVLRAGARSQTLILKSAPGNNSGQKNKPRKRTQ